MKSNDSIILPKIKSNVYSKKHNSNNVKQLVNNKASTANTNHKLILEDTNIYSKNLHPSSNNINKLSINQRKELNDKTRYSINNKNNNFQNEDINKIKKLNKMFNNKNCKSSAFTKLLSYSEKNEYQKKLTNQSALEKYKLLCMHMLKEDEDIRKLLEILKITEFSKFLDNHLFSDLLFLYRLEVFLIHKNGNSKNQKQQFFKEELLNILEYKQIDFAFNTKLNELNNNLDAEYKLVNEFAV